MTPSERSFLVECSDQVEDSLIRLEREERNLTNYILRLLLRIARVLLNEKLRS